MANAIRSIVGSPRAGGAFVSRENYVPCRITGYFGSKLISAVRWTVAAIGLSPTRKRASPGVHQMAMTSEYLARRAGGRVDWRQTCLPFQPAVANARRQSDSE